MKRIITVVTFAATALLVTGCTKCSSDNPTDAPPPVESAPPPADPSATPPTEGQPAEPPAPETAPGSEAPSGH
jgi:hypothetical protein